MAYLENSLEATSIRRLSRVVRLLELPLTQLTGSSALCPPTYYPLYLFTVRLHPSYNW